MREPTQQGLTPQTPAEHEQTVEERYGELLGRYDIARDGQQERRANYGGAVYTDPWTNGTVYFSNDVKGKALDGVRAITRIADVGSDKDPTSAHDTIVLGRDVIIVHEYATHGGEVELDRETVYDITSDDERTA